MLSNAKKATVVTAKDPKKAKRTEPLAGVAELAALEHLQESVAAMIAMKKTEVLDAGLDIQINRGMNKKGRPDTLYVEDNGDGSFKGTGNVQVKRRSSASAVTEEQADILNEHGIPYQASVHTETYVVNAKYADDKDLFARIDKALSRVQGIPEDFFEIIEEDSKPIVTDESMDAVFRLGDKKLIKELLPLVSTSLVSGLSVTDNDAAIKSIEASIMAKIFKRVRVAAGSKKAA